VKRFEEGVERGEKQVNPHSLEIHIEEIVLCGFPPIDRYRLGEAVELELGRLFGQEGAPPSLGVSREIGRLDCGSFEVPDGSTPEETGTRVARALFGRLAE